ncbi:hypothetical protein JQ628_11180 [Bradyrhizobium lablabi]|uniref:hypothetical protein n=1 Tax=Bradyrhizobium lablabi TaxID=722472 RepID=UPI001BABCB18|nr:hypothetical protein [Bradyrhizobium lablabi]MBR1122078.1 hypothetical protein [Bradyrhizobium lablabi]
MGTPQANEIRRLHRVVRENNQTDFMSFWETLNGLLKSRGLPELGYSEARGYYADYRAQW